MQKIKIIFVLSNLHVGGAQRTILNIVNGLNKSQYVIKLVLLKKTENETYLQYLDQDIQYEYINKQARYSFFSLRRIIKSYEPQIVLSTLGYVNILTAFSCAFLKDKPIVILRESAYRNFENTLHRFFYQKAHKLADFSIALSESVKQNMITNYKISAEKIEVIYNPLNLSLINEQKVSNVDFKYSKTLKLVSAGRLVTVKNHIMIINALHYFDNTFHHDFELVILGDGPLKPQLQKEVKLLNLENRIHFLGNVRNPYPYIKKADIMILSSLSEGFGHVIAEAMVCETLIVSTDCTGGPREIIQDKYGVLVPVNDNQKLAEKIHYYSENKIAYRKKVTAASIRVQDFDVRTVVTAYEKRFAILMKQLGRD